MPGNPLSPNSFRHHRPAPRHKRSYRTSTFTSEPGNDLAELWMLRILVKLGGLWEAVSPMGFRDDDLGRRLGLGHLIDADKPFDVHAARNVLSARLGGMERDANSLAMPLQLARNLDRLGAAFGFDEVDKCLLGFAILIHSERTLDDVADYLGPLSGARLRQVLAELLGLTSSAVTDALEGRARLATTGMLVVARGGGLPLRMKLELWSDGLADRMLASDADPIALMQQAFFTSSPGHLCLRDFEHLDGPLRLLHPYLRKALSEARSGVNVLLHGMPGTGKTQLAKALAAEFGAELFEVSSEDEDGDPVPGGRRLFAYRAAQQVLAGRRAMLLFDEVEDVLGSGGNPFVEAASRGRKAWINKALEANSVPALWLSNAIDDIDPAFLRRFDMVIEVAIPPSAKRADILARAAGNLLPAAHLDRLAACEHLAPAVVVRAASVVSYIGDAVEPEERASALCRLVNQSLAAQRLPTLPVGCDATPYNPEFSNADADLLGVAEGIAASESGARLCLFGLPGTGKTAWAHWLARHLGRPLVTRHASELLGKYVGQSEKNIGQAFAEARDRSAVLLIDEVDSFMRRREGASTQWQVSLVNEMLTQMEAFDGLFVATTNLLDSLDAAALRRFDLKIRFGALNGAQTAALLERSVASLGLPPADDVLLESARLLQGVTPGDFASVSRQHRFRKLHTAVEMLDAVRAEVELRRDGHSRPIGFVVAG